jgi:hypothetical protein
MEIMGAVYATIPDAELRRQVENQLDAARRVYARIAKEGK